MDLVNLSIHSHINIRLALLIQPKFTVFTIKQGCTRGQGFNTEDPVSALEKDTTIVKDRQVNKQFQYKR